MEDARSDNRKDAPDARMAIPKDARACFICSKHHSPEARGMAVYEDAYVVASLMIAGAEERRAYLGYAIVETKRHAPALGDLHAQEAGAFGEAMNRVSAALRKALNAEHVYAFVQGDGVPHFHMHLVPRYAGTPDRYRHPVNILQWPDAPRGGAAELEAIRDSVRAALANVDEASCGRGEPAS